jgi:hypothetical protein
MEVALFRPLQARQATRQQRPRNPTRSGPAGWGPPWPNLPPTPLPRTPTIGVDFSSELPAGRAEVSGAVAVRQQRERMRRVGLFGTPSIPVASLTIPTRADLSEGHGPPRRAVTQQRPNELALSSRRYCVLFCKTDREARNVLRAPSRLCLSSSLQKSQSLPPFSSPMYLNIPSLVKTSRFALFGSVASVCT